jgi:hypothetical protein
MLYLRCVRVWAAGTGCDTSRTLVGLATAFEYMSIWNIRMKLRIRNYKFMLLSGLYKLHVCYGLFENRCPFPPGFSRTSPTAIRKVWWLAQLQPYLRANVGWKERNAPIISFRSIFHFPPALGIVCTKCHHICCLVCLIQPLVPISSTFKSFKYLLPKFVG